MLSVTYCITVLHYDTKKKDTVIRSKAKPIETEYAGLLCGKGDF